MRFCARRTRPPARARSLSAIASKHATAPGAAARLSSPRVEQRDERIIVETDRHRITGLLRLPRDGYRSRLTDYLNAAGAVSSWPSPRSR